MEKSRASEKRKRKRKQEKGIKEYIFEERIKRQIAD